jgi:hypothetical protein
MTVEFSQTRLPLIDDISQTFDKLPPINLFRAAANAKTLYPAFIEYVYLLFKPLELDGRIERLVVLYVGKLSDCIYIWRQNVVVAESLGITQEEIDALERDDTRADCLATRKRLPSALRRRLFGSLRSVTRSVPKHHDSSPRKPLRNSFTLLAPTCCLPESHGPVECPSMRHLRLQRASNSYLNRQVHITLVQYLPNSWSI